MLGTQSCDMLESHPYDAYVRGEKNLNEKNIRLLEEKLKEPRYQHDSEDYFVGIIEAIEIVKGGAKWVD